MSTSIDYFTNRVLSEVKGCPKLVAQDVLMDVLQDFCSRTLIVQEGWEHTIEDTDPDSTLNDSIDVTTPTAKESWIPCGILRLQIDGYDYLTEERYIPDDITDFDEGLYVDGKKFFYYSDTTTIVMYPFDSVDADMFVLAAFKPSTSITTVDDDFYRAWHYVIEAGVMARLFEMANQPWSDPNFAMVKLARYESGVGSAKCKVSLAWPDRTKTRRSKDFI